MPAQAKGKHVMKAALVTEFKERFGKHVKREDWPAAWDAWVRHLWHLEKLTMYQRNWINPFVKKPAKEETV